MALRGPKQREKKSQSYVGEQAATTAYHCFLPEGRFPVSPTGYYLGARTLSLGLDSAALTFAKV